MQTLSMEYEILGPSASLCNTSIPRKEVYASTVD